MPAKKTTKKATTTASRSTKSKRTKSKKSPSPKSRSTNKSKAKSKAGEQEVTIDRRRQADRRDGSGEESNPVQPQLEKRTKVQRRRQIDPTTCERDYSEAEVEFMNAMDEYKRTSGRMFPTCSEVLEVIRDLGYVQLTPAEKAIVRPEPVEELAADEAEQGEADPGDMESADLEAEEELTC